MPSIDSSIATSGKQFQLADPVQQYSNMLAIENAQQQGRTGQLQYQNMLRANQEQDATNAAYKNAIGPDGQLIENRLISGLASSGAGASRILTAQEFFRKMNKDKVDEDKSRYEIVGKADSFYKNLIGQVNGPDEAKMWVLAQHQDPYLGPILRRAGSVNDAISRIPNDGAEFNQWKMRQGLSMKDFIEKTTPKIQPVDLGGTVGFANMNPLAGPPGPMAGVAEVPKTPTISELETARRNTVTERIAGDNLKVNQQQLADSRDLVFQRNLAAAKEGVDGRPLTEAQGNATGFGLRAREAADLINELETNGTFGRLANVNSAIRSGLERVPIVGTAAGGLIGGAGHLALSTKQQQYAQARDNFIRAVLRKESGATISPAEIQGAEEQYFPRAGENKTVIKQKQDNRETAIESLKIQAGPGARKIPARKAAPDLDVSKMSDADLKKSLGLPP